MSDFDIAIKFVLSNEGGLVNNPNDPGGITNFGISLRFLKSTNQKYDFNGDGIINENEIIDLKEDQAKLIYKNEFWNLSRFDKINNQTLCNYIFDMAVNSGHAMSIKLAQRALCSFNKQRNFVLDDGILGTKTLDELNHCGLLLLPALISERTGYYRLLSAIKPEHKDDLNGWLNRSFKI